jgi:hypothetical protein
MAQQTRCTYFVTRRNRCTIYIRKHSSCLEPLIALRKLDVDQLLLGRGGIPRILIALSIVRDLLGLHGGGVIGLVESFEQLGGLVLTREFELNVYVHPSWSPQRGIEGLVSIHGCKQQLALLSTDSVRSVKQTRSMRFWGYQWMEVLVRTCHQRWPSSRSLNSPGSD